MEVARSFPVEKIIGVLWEQETEQGTAMAGTHQHGAVLCLTQLRRRPMSRQKSLTYSADTTRAQDAALQVARLGATVSLDARTTYNIFTVARHLTTARTHRLFRAEAFAEWRDAADVLNEKGQDAFKRGRNRQRDKSSASPHLRPTLRLFRADAAHV